MYQRVSQGFDEGGIEMGYNGRKQKEYLLCGRVIPEADLGPAYKSRLRHIKNQLRREGDYGTKKDVQDTAYRLIGFNYDAV
jgi:hypothetical protein